MRILSIAIITLFLSGAARAEILTYRLESEIISTSGTTPASLSVGTLFDLTFSYDTAISGIYSPSLDRHVFPGAFKALSMSGPTIDIEYNFSDPLIRAITAIRNDSFTGDLLTFDALDLGGGTVPSIDGLAVQSFQVGFQDGSGSIFLKGDTLPTELSLADFTSIGGSFRFGSPDGEAVFTVDSIAVVPVPAAAWLFAVAILGFLGVSRRKT
jgi:hypothetical protein